LRKQAVPHNHHCRCADMAAAPLAVAARDGKELP
jgi:hypothetical protein